MRGKFVHIAAGLCCAIALAAGGTACAGPPESDPDEITIWHTESTPTTIKALDQIIAAYEEQHPGVHVTQETVAWGDLQVKLQAALSAGDLPEITHVEAMFVRTLHDQGLLAPVDPVVDELGSDYQPELRKMFAYPDGHDYGVVHAWGTDLTTYRKDLYRKAGADAPEKAHTWSQWADQLEQVSQLDGVSGLQLAGAETHNVNEEVYQWLGSNGGSLFDDRGRPTIDTPQMVEVLKFWHSLKQRGILDSGWSSAAYQDTLSSLALGNTGTILSFGRATYTFEEQAPQLAKRGDIGVAPTKPHGPSGKDWITQLDAEPWVAFKDAPASSRANDFLKFFYKKRNYLKWVGSVPTQMLPVRQSMYDDPAYKRLPEVDDWRFWIDMQKKTLASGRAFPLMVTRPADLELPYLSDLYGSGILADMAKRVVEQDEDPVEAAANAQARAEELLSGRYEEAGS